MDRKLRISFFPADASRVRFLSISRRLTIVVVSAAVLLCLFGFWLLLSGALHEKSEKTAVRRRLQSENAALRERVEALEGDASEVEKGLKRLEALKVDALLATGLVNPNQARGSDAGGLWKFFRKRPSEKTDPASDLTAARSISLFYDSTLVVLMHAKEESETFPTGMPVPRTAMLTRTFGITPDPFTGKRSLHPGVDFSDKTGAPIRAAGAGEVVAVMRDPIWGLTVRLRHRPGMETVYAHLASTKVTVGQSLHRGDVLGLLGETGQSTGPHLHYELRLQGDRVNPMQFLLPIDAGRGSL